jgi:hypothetical protein
MAEDVPGVGRSESSDAALFEQMARLPRWFSAAALQPVADINRRVLALMVAEPAPLRVPPHIAQSLRCLDPSALEQIARCPCLLVDAGFRDEQRWKSLRRAASGAEESLLPVASPSVVCLARLTFFVAWHYLRCYPEPATLVIGVRTGVGQALSALTIDELDRLAQTHSDWVQPRWMDRPSAWEKLISTSKAGGRPLGADLRGLQLALGELLDGAIE